LTVQRFDRFEIQATKTPEGFIQDSPILGRVGIMEYRQPNGSIRREFRPPEEAFKADSLATLKGKPVTVGHPGLVRADNVKAVQPIGTVLTEGKQDGDFIRADVVIYNLDTAGRELSCGYALDTEETPGEWRGQHYDAVQRNIRYNHVAVVPKGRAGPTARLNMDGSQEYEYEEEQKTMKIRLDSGLEYDAAPEVIVAFDKLKQDNANLLGKNQTLKTNLDTTEAKADTLQAEKTKLDEQLKAKDKEHADSLNEAVKQRVSLLSVAGTHNIDKADELSDRQIKEAVVKSVRGDGMDLTAKSDEYVNAAFDLCKEDNRQDTMSQQRKQVKNPGSERKDEAPSSAADARQKMIENQQNAYKGGKE